MEIKGHLARVTKQFVLLCGTAIFLLKSLSLFLSGKNTLNVISQLDHQLTCLADVYRSHLIYFQVYNEFRILPNKTI